MNWHTKNNMTIVSDIHRHVVNHLQQPRRIISIFVLSYIIHILVVWATLLSPHSIRFGDNSGFPRYDLQPSCAKKSGFWCNISLLDSYCFLCLVHNCSMFIALLLQNSNPWNANPRFPYNKEIVNPSILLGHFTGKLFSISFVIFKTLHVQYILYKSYIIFGENSWHHIYA